MTEGRERSRVAWSAEGAVAEPLPSFASELLQDDEVVIIAIKPSLWYVAISSTGALMAIAILMLAMAWASRLPWAGWTDVQAFGMGVALTSLRLLWGVAEWANRLYVMTDRRLIARYGVIRLQVFEAPLKNVQHTSMFVSVRERLLGLGTIGFATSGSDTFDAWWAIIRRPIEVHRTVVEVLQRYGGRGK